MEVKLDTSVLDALIAASPAKAERAVADTALAVQGKSAMAAPYDTGALSNSMTSESESRLTWKVRDGVSYGVFNELGTHKMGARPFLAPAVESEREPFIQRLALVAKP